MHSGVYVKQSVVFVVFDLCMYEHFVRIPVLQDLFYLVLILYHLSNVCSNSFPSAGPRLFLFGMYHFDIRVLQVLGTVPTSLPVDPVLFCYDVICYAG